MYICIYLRRHIVIMLKRDWDVSLQMGSPEEVQAAEQVNITLSCAKGMLMHAIPRVTPMKA